MISTTILVLVCLEVTIASSVDLDIGWRVVGGNDALPGEFPFIYSLRGTSGSHSCGGSFLNENWAITAAHCVVGMQASYFTLVAGTNQLNDSNATRIKISRIIVHPDYDARTIQNDLALLQLSERLQLTSQVQTIDIEKDIVDSNRNCTLIGWGRLSATGNVPNNLQCLDSSTIPLNQCRSLWTTNTIYNSQLCTLTSIGEGACYGDSGGPLVVNKNGKFTLIALVSWGSPCARGMPDVYTRVASFESWITGIISN